MKLIIDIAAVIVSVILVGGLLFYGLKQAKNDAEQRKGQPYDPWAGWF